MTINKVVLGSVSVSNSVAFTDADSADALAGQSALASVLQSGDVSSIFGTTFGTVTVSNVAQGNATNPSKFSIQLSRHCFLIVFAVPILVSEHVLCCCSSGKWCNSSRCHNVDTRSSGYRCNIGIDSVICFECRKTDVRVWEWQFLSLEQ